MLRAYSFKKWIPLCIIILLVFRYVTYPIEDSALAYEVLNQNQGHPSWYLMEVTHEPDLKGKTVHLRLHLQATVDIPTEEIFSAFMDTDGGYRDKKIPIWGAIKEKYKLEIHDIESVSNVGASLHQSLLGEMAESMGKESIEIGDLIIVSGIFHKEFQDNPIPADAEFNNYLKKEKLFYEMKIQKVVAVESGYTVFSKASLVRLRKMIEGEIADLLPRPQSDLAQGLIVSGKGSLSNQLLDEFKKVGLIHIVVLSGSNVSIISAGLFSLLGSLPQTAKVIAGILGMSAFAIMTGGSPPVVRSVLMTSVPLMGSLFQGQSKVPELSEAKDTDIAGEKLQSLTTAKTFMGRESESPIYLLFVCAGLMAVYNPLLPLYDISFQLSFAATLGLVLLTKPISSLLFWIPETFGLREIIASSLGTQFFVLPILLTFSDQVSLVFLIANCLVLPILPCIMLCIFLMALTGFIMDILAYPFELVTWSLLTIVLKMVHGIATIPFATITVKTISIAMKWKIMCAVTIVSLWIHRRTNRKKLDVSHDSP